MSQTLKSVEINAFFALRIFERQDLLVSPESFYCIENYRNCLTQVQSTADFMSDVSQEFLSYATQIQLIQLQRQEDNKQDKVLEGEEKKRLVDLAHRKKRELFFNTVDGTALRLLVLCHITQTSDLAYCALCGQHQLAWRGHRSTYCCHLCAVHSFFRVYPGLKKCCWSI